MRGHYRRTANERGSTLVLVALSMVALLGFAALAVDVGNLYVVRGELQRTADAAALAGAGRLLVDPDDSLGAVAEAIAFVGRNQDLTEGAYIQNGDVDVLLDEWKVKVRVYASADRGTEVPTFFAKVLGINTVNVTARAQAWAAPSSGVEAGSSWQDCLLPIGLLDYYDANGDGEYTAGEPELNFGEDESGHGLLLKLSFSGSTGTGPPACRTEPPWGGETQPSVGVFNGTPNVDYCNIPSESWSCFWRKELPSGGGSGGSDWVGDAIAGNTCVDLEAGSTVYAASASGEKQAVISSSGGPGSFRDVIQADLDENSGVDLVWCPAGSGGTNSIGCPKRGGCGGECVTENRRLRTAPIIDAASVLGGGAGTNFTINEFTGIFIERVACAYDQGPFGGPQGNWNAYIRLMTAGSGAGEEGEDEGGEDNALLRTLRLIPYAE